VMPQHSAARADSVHAASWELAVLAQISRLSCCVDHQHRAYDFLRA
jgi:hypothetical protein